MPDIDIHFDVQYDYPVVFTKDVFNTENPVLVDIFKKTGQKNRILVVIDSNVAASTPDLISRIGVFFRQYDDIMDMVAPAYIMTGGEVCKNTPHEVEKIQILINKNHLCRHCFIMVIGGGAVLDAAGYAVATAHRGLRLLRLPTTTLAQNDAGVGVKNAINKFGKKNWLGTFAPAFAVVNDLLFLKTLNTRDLRAGISEAVKVALIKDRFFFDYLYDRREALRDFEPESMQEMIIRCARLHVDHIRNSGDPFERGSSRPLDFGHWAAHKIEDLADDDIRHGEAVAVGIALDAHYAHYCGCITEIELYRILSLMECIGFKLFHPALLQINIEASIREFQEHMGGTLAIPMICGIGKLTEAAIIDTGLIIRGIKNLEDRYNSKKTHEKKKRIQSDASHKGRGDVFS
ncbi:MAG: 3-dehydroquinate synthase [Desulfobacteraceae bacterium]|nr:3-dehydroquinate synthase [Desulfobacteraceae bacterium]